MKKTTSAPRLTGALLCWLWCQAGIQTAAAQAFLDMSLEDLARTKVALVSRKDEDVRRAPAAVSVLSAADLRRAGYTHLAEALRMVPGFHVGRIDANKWAVSARGFNGRFANKLLVLVDGRSVYTPLFSGVYWEMLDLNLADVERIEVIRGPGAALWGSNAVNGVVNVITKRADRTQGAALGFGAGSEDRGQVRGRYGGRLGDSAHYRVYGRYIKRDDLVGTDGVSTRDAWTARAGGLRLDWVLGPADELGLAADFYDGSLGESAPMFSPQAPYQRLSYFDNDLRNQTATLRWTRALGAASDLGLVAYYDRLTQRESARRNTFNVDLQHRLTPHRRHQILWGVGYRLMRDDQPDSTFSLSYRPHRRDMHLLNAFVQDDADLVPGRLRLLAGARLERHTFTGFEVQPNLRLTWTPHPRHSLWTALSRAVRIPSRAEADATLVIAGIAPAGADAPPTFLSLKGSRAFQSEQLYSAELGYRLDSGSEAWSLDLTAFHHQYSRLRSFSLGAAALSGTPPLHNIIPISAANELAGTARGLEAEWRLRPAPWSTLHAAYSFFDLDLDDLGVNAFSIVNAGSSPTHQLGCWWTARGPSALEFNAGWRYVGGLDSQPAVGSYTGLDLGLGWRPVPGLKIDLRGYNLLAGRHAEFDRLVLATRLSEVERGFGITLNWQP